MDKTTAAYEIKSLFRGQLLSYMVGFYLFAFYLELHFRFPILQAIRFQFSYGALIGAMCLYKYVNSKNRQVNFNAVTKTTFLLIFIMGIYTIFSMDRPESIYVYKDRVIKFALVAFFIYTATDKVEDLRVILAFIFLAWLKLGQEGFLGWSTGSLMWENQGVQRLHGSTAMYGHPNSYSGFAVGCLSVSAFVIMGVKSNLLRLGLLTLIFTSLIIIVNTGSRTGYVAVIIGSIYIFSQLNTSKFKILIIVFCTILATSFFVPDQYKERFNSIFTGQAKEGNSAGTRKEILTDAIEIYMKYPLGIGLQAFSKVRYEIFARSQNTHNLYLEVLTNIGPFGFIVFSIFVWRIIKTNLINIKKITACTFNTNDKLFLTSLCKAMICFVLMRLLLGLFGMDMYEIYWWVALGFSLAIAKLIYLNKKTEEKKSLQEIFK